MSGAPSWATRPIARNPSRRNNDVSSSQSAAVLPAGGSTPSSSTGSESQQEHQRRTRRDHREPPALHGGRPGPRAPRSPQHHEPVRDPDPHRARHPTVAELSEERGPDLLHHQPGERPVTAVIPGRTDRRQRTPAGFADLEARRQLVHLLEHDLERPRLAGLVALLGKASRSTGGRTWPSRRRRPGTTPSARAAGSTATTRSAASTATGSPPRSPSATTGQSAHRNAKVRTGPVRSQSSIRRCARRAAPPSSPPDPPSLARSGHLDSGARGAGGPPGATARRDGDGPRRRGDR